MEPASLDELHDLVQLGQTSHRRAEDGEQLEEDQAEVDGDVAAAGGAAGDEAAAFGERAQGTLEGLAADVLDDDVDAALLRKTAHVIEKIDFGVEDHLVRAEGHRARGLLRGAGGGVDRGTPQLGDLNGCAADSRAA